MNKLEDELSQTIVTPLYKKDHSLMSVASANICILKNVWECFIVLCFCKFNLLKKKKRFTVYKMYSSKKKIASLKCFLFYYKWAHTPRSTHSSCNVWLLTPRVTIYLPCRKSSGHTKQQSPTAEKSSPPATPMTLWPPFQLSTAAANKSAGADLTPAVMSEALESGVHK